MIYNFVVVWNMIEVDLANHPPKFADTADIYNISGYSAVGRRGSPRPADDTGEALR